MKEYGFGADVGGTTIKMGLFQTDGTLLDKWEIPTDTSNCGEGILQDIADSVHNKMVDVVVEGSDALQFLPRRAMSLSASPGKG